MGELRAIDTGAFAKLAPPDQGGGAEPGPAPMLQWVAIADLVVDETYQRPIYGAGRANVQRIAQAFRWSKFAPVIVAPIAGGKFAIIDGQHRTTAAALLGFDTVPAQVIVADRAEQAAAFKSINGQVTRIHSLALHHAALAAGDPAAAQLDAVCAEAGVRILRYPKPAGSLEPGDTLALGTLATGLKMHGRAVLIAALRCITQTDNNRPGVLAATLIQALIDVARVRPHRALEALAAETNLEAALEAARVTPRPKGVATWQVLANALRDRLDGKQFAERSDRARLVAHERDRESSVAEMVSANRRHLADIAAANRGRGFPAPRQDA